MLGAWLIEEGASFRAGEILAEIVSGTIDIYSYRSTPLQEADKHIYLVIAEIDGVLQKVLVRTWSLLCFAWLSVPNVDTSDSEVNQFRLERCLHSYRMTSQTSTTLRTMGTTTILYPITPSFRNPFSPQGPPLHRFHPHSISTFRLVTPTVTCIM